jgi:protein arginine kinase activator
MLCQRCKKAVATVHLTEIVNSEKRERHLCEACAKEEHVAVHTQVNLQDILAGMLEAHESAGEYAGLTCPDCGITYAEFRRQGRLGCPGDYEVFAEPLREILEKVHGSAEHTGKVPRRARADMEGPRELMRLRRELREAVEREEYEEAARLRDEIKQKEAESGSG